MKKIKLILHIGTHKTGTSAIQSTLANNANLIKNKGIYYGLTSQNTRNINFLAADIANGRHVKAKNFFTHLLKQAKAKKCDVVVLSGESFFAMTTFFDVLNRNVSVPSNYWELESEKIDFLRAQLSSFEVHVVCYLRNQLSFADSIYNQFVKQDNGYQDSLQRFLEQSQQAFEYNSFIDLWKEKFGKKKVSVYSYDNNKRDIVEHFFENVLGITDFENFRKPNGDINTRLSQEALKFKHDLNRQNFDPVNSFVASKIVLELDKKNGNNSPSFNYRIYEKVLRIQEYSNKKLLIKNKLTNDFFDLPEKNVSLTRYDYENSDNYRFPDEEFWVIFNSPKIRFIVFFRKSYHFFSKNIRFFKYIDRPIRIIVNKIKLKKEFNG